MIYSVKVELIKNIDFTKYKSKKKELYITIKLSYHESNDSKQTDVAKQSPLTFKNHQIKSLCRHHPIVEIKTGPRHPNQLEI